MSKPTTEQYGAYQGAWDYFNQKLFAGKLQPCILNFSRKAKSYGFFCSNKWTKNGKSTHEISLNPDVLERPIKYVLSTLVHEMCHQWQQDCGTPPRRCYHDTEWANQMEAVGLMPSDTGEPGGKRTGQQMTHFIIPDGPFEKAFNAMPRSLLIPWTSSAPEQATKPVKKSKIKYTCAECGQAAWGKPGLAIGCMTCDVQMRSQDDAEEDE